jgi:ribosomal protein S18 acetylase RimI-like enzyme
MHTLLGHCACAEPGTLGAPSARSAERMLADSYSLDSWHVELKAMPQRAAYLMMLDSACGQIVGLAVGTLRNDHQPGVPKQHNGHLRHLVVHPACRGLGKASILLDAFASRIREIGGKGLRLNVFASQTTALAVYQHHGFVVRRTTPDTTNPDLALHHMSRVLETARPQRAAAHHASA